MSRIEGAQGVCRSWAELDIMVVWGLCIERSSEGCSLDWTYELLGSSSTSANQTYAMLHQLVTGCRWLDWLGWFVEGTAVNQTLAPNLVRSLNLQLMRLRASFLGLGLVRIPFFKQMSACNICKMVKNDELQTLFKSCEISICFFKIRFSSKFHNVCRFKFPSFRWFPRCR